MEVVATSDNQVIIAYETNPTPYTRALEEAVKDSVEP